jgi:septation ring formation regulator EzrA
MAVNKLIISQLKGIKNTYNNQDVGTFIILNNLSKRIDEISNRLAVSYSQNYVESKNELLDIKNELMKLIESGAVDTNIYKYLQKVLFFANKYRYEDENIKKKLEMSERMIEEKKYANALDNLISLLEQIKSSAETNNVAFK